MRRIIGTRILGECWTWLERELRQLVGMLSVIVCSGCATHIVVDTSDNDPLIYAPGTVQGKDFSLTLDGLRLGCEQWTIKNKFGQVTLSQPRWKGNSAPLHAHVSHQVVLNIVKAGRSDAFKQFADDFNAINAKDGSTTCKLESESENKDIVNLLAAEALMRQLPLPYSDVLRVTYNHRVWNGNPGGITIDLSPGMRLRVENSVPLAPDGLGVPGGHPASFAAPTYLYFDALTASELCNPGYAHANGHICKEPSETWENYTYLSVSGGLARLGLAQQVSNTAQDGLEPSSGLLDLLERQRVGGIGASSYWRLWLPATRMTRTATPVFDPNGGSRESLDPPLLVSAESLQALGEIDWTKSLPCANAPSPTGCYSLHYRAMPLPEIAIRVNGTKEWVPIGTTLQDLLAGRLHAGFTASMPYLAIASTSKHHIQPAALQERLYRAAMEGVSIRRFDWRGLHKVLPNHLNNSRELVRFMRLQLLPGDEIQWN